MTANLIVNQNEIETVDMFLEGKSLNDRTNKSLVFEEKNYYLSTSTPNSAILWSVYIYPEGSEIDGFGDDLLKPNDSSKNRLVIRRSNNGSVQIFQRVK